MSNFAQLSPLQRKRREAEMADFGAMLEILPHAALCVDDRSQEVLYANRKALELFAYKNNNLQGLPVSRLLVDLPESEAARPDWREQATTDLFQAPLVIQQAVLSNRRLVRVLTSHRLLLTSTPKTLILIEPESELQQRAGLNQNPRLWEGLHDLEKAPQHADLMAALNQAVEAVRQLTDADAVAVYRAGGQAPGLALCAIAGDPSLLPPNLPAQDLNDLRKAHLWKPGRRPVCSLHSFARSAKLSYLASVPLGQAGAAIGLVVAASAQQPPADVILHAVQSLANTATTILQTRLVLEARQEELDRQALEIGIGSGLEDASQEGVVLLSADLKVLRMNRSAEMMLGYASNEVNRQPVENVLVTAEPLIAGLNDVLTRTTLLNLGNMRLYRRNGEAFLSRLRALPVMHKGQLERLLLLVQDLSEAEQIHEHTQQLEQRAVLGELTAVFAHEVRNPINNISTGLQLLAYNLPETEANQELIGRLQQDLDRLEVLMRGILSYSRPTDYEMQPTDIEELLRRLLERLHPRLAKLEVKYQLKAEKNCPLILGNARALEQVFSNLINNALQAMTETGGRLAIKVQRYQPKGSNETVSDRSLGLEPRSYVEVTVADTGPGIPRELQDRIFQPFFTTRNTGTGLGLAISKRILVAHKGTIRLTSFTGGTIFHVILPTAN